MKTTYFIALFVLAFGLQSCVITNGKVGNGHVILENRPVSAEFNAIKSSAGIDVYITQGNENEIVVETDENLQEYIATEISGNTLKIYPEKSIRRSKALKVHVTFIDIERLSASSASSINTTSEIRSQNLDLSTSSGASASLEVLSENLEAKASSGSEITLSGKAQSFLVQSTSGATIRARDLQTIRCSATASSGSEIRVHVKEELEASASSGADIRYFGEAGTSIKQSSGGSVRKRE